MNQVEGTILFLILSSFFLTGLFIGWAWVKERYILLIIGLFLLAPILEITMYLDHWLFTGLVVLGFLVHTAKPLYHKAQDMLPWL